MQSHIEVSDWRDTNAVREPLEVASQAAMEAHQLRASLCWKASEGWVDKTWLAMGYYLSMRWESQKSLKKDQ